jgi:hypothetical protein
MIRTTLELWPHGSAIGKHEIADICVANVGATNEGHNYVYYAHSDRGVYKGKVYNHERSKGIFVLMQRVYEMIAMENRMHHFFTEYELRVLDTMKKHIGSKEHAIEN